MKKKSIVLPIVICIILISNLAMAKEMITAEKLLPSEIIENTLEIEKAENLLEEDIEEEKDAKEEEVLVDEDYIKDGKVEEDVVESLKEDIGEELDDIKVYTNKADDDLVRNSKRSKIYLNSNVFSSISENIFNIFYIRENANIKSNKIIMYQNGKVIGRANNVISRSIVNNYKCENFYFINEFENKNGINEVDIVFYLGNKEVYRADGIEVYVTEKETVEQAFPIEIGLETSKIPLFIGIINSDLSNEIEVLIKDFAGSVIGKSEKTYFDFMDGDYRNIKILVGFDDSSHREYDEYSLHIYSNGKEIDIIPYAGEIGEYIEVYPVPIINSILTIREDHDEYIYEVSGYNLLNNGPYHLVIYQDNEVVSEIRGIDAELIDYEEIIKYKLEPEHFKNYGEMFRVELYNSKDQLMSDIIFLELEDDIEDDDIDPELGYKVFRNLGTVEANSNRYIKFNKEVNETTIGTDNIYIINTKTGEFIDTDNSLESDKKTVRIKPKRSLEPGEEYRVIIEGEVEKSELIRGNNKLKDPVTVKFNVK